MEEVKYDYLIVLGTLYAIEVASGIKKGADSQFGDGYIHRALSHRSLHFCSKIHVS